MLILSTNSTLHLRYQLMRMVDMYKVAPLAKLKSLINLSCNNEFLQDHNILSISYSSRNKTYQPRSIVQISEDDMVPRNVNIVTHVLNKVNPEYDLTNNHREPIFSRILPYLRNLVVLIPITKHSHGNHQCSPTDFVLLMS